MFKQVCLCFVSWIPIIQPTALCSLSQNEHLLSLFYAHREIRIFLLLSDFRSKSSLCISFYPLDLGITHATHLWLKCLKQRSKLPVFTSHSVPISPCNTNTYIHTQEIHFNWLLFLWRNKAKGRDKYQRRFPRGLATLTIILCVLKYILNLRSSLKYVEVRRQIFFHMALRSLVEVTEV